MSSRGDRLEDLLPDEPAAGPTQAVCATGDMEAIARSAAGAFSASGAIGSVLAAGKIPAGMLFANIPALPERCPDCEKIHVRRDGCGSTPRPGLVEVVNTDPPLPGLERPPQPGATLRSAWPPCGALSMAGAECTERPGHAGWHRGLVGDTPVEWT